MKKIPLTQNKFALVDDCDYTFLMQWKWCYGDGGYAVRKNDKQKIRMHRVILERMGFKDFTLSDHINRNKLDNRRCNLRPATDRESSYNRGKRKDNTSGYKGVHWCKGKWRARIQINKKLKHLGLYNDPKEAARAYNKAAKKYHGEFAVLNEV